MGKLKDRFNGWRQDRGGSTADTSGAVGSLDNNKGNLKRNLIVVGGLGATAAVLATGLIVGSGIGENRSNAKEMATTAEDLGFSPNLDGFTNPRVTARVGECVVTFTGSNISDTGERTVTSRVDGPVNEFNGPEINSGVESTNQPYSKVVSENPGCVVPKSAMPDSLSDSVKNALRDWQSNGLGEVAAAAGVQAGIDEFSVVVKANGTPRIAVGDIVNNPSDGGNYTAGVYLGLNAEGKVYGSAEELNTNSNGFPIMTATWHVSSETLKEKGNNSDQIAFQMS